MVQQNIDESNDAEDGKKDAEIELPEENLVKLEGMGFIKSADKPGLFVKEIDDVNFFWDFRKVKTGSAYASKIKESGEGFDNIPRNELEQMEEYLILRPEKKGKTVKKKEKTDVKTKAMVPASDKKAGGLMRGSERDLIRLMDTRIQLDSIIDASSNNEKLGEGLLWHELKFGKDRIHVEPSAELVDMITQDAGHITTRIVEFEQYTITDPNTNDKYGTYYCVVEAKDEITGTTGLGAAEQIIDFDEIKKGRTFARTNAIRKAERNAKERLIPIPRKAMVFLIRKKLDEYVKAKNKE